MRMTFAVLLAVSAAPIQGALAQRRTTDGGGGDRRPAPQAQPAARPSGDAPRSTGSSGGRATPAETPRTRPEGRTDGRSVREGDGRATRPSAARTGRTASGGKISDVRRSAREARQRSGGRVIIDRGVYIGGCYGCDYWGWYGGRYGWYRGGWWYPAYDQPYYGGGYTHRDDAREDADDAGGRPDVGYMAYPYAENDGTGSTFMRARTRERHAFGAFSGQYFADQASPMRAGRFALQGAYKTLRGDLEYGYYQERVPTGTDRLHTFRIGIGAQPRLGTKGFLIAGIAARNVSLGDGSNAAGPEGELGLQLFPQRPLGVSVTGRLAALKWDGANEYFTFRELNASGSIHVGAMEIQAGYHWMQIGRDTEAFSGPVIGTRFWF